VRTDEAILLLRSDPAQRGLIEDLFLDEDSSAAARRFADSAEFREVVERVGPLLRSGRVLDLGAGTGVASAALARAGAAYVVAIEPDSSDVVGFGCLGQVVDGLPVGVVASFGEALPISPASIDVVFCRQVLHHTTDLDATLNECARVLAPGGMLIACREHVVDDDGQLAKFLAEHVVHQLAGGEHAYSLPAYLAAIRGAGLELVSELGPWDSIINAYPTVTTSDDLVRVPQVVLGRRFGRAGQVAGALPCVHQLAWARLRRAKPGRFYSFVAIKP
jgi:SAM-dependent methyltransferase